MSSIFDVYKIINEIKYKIKANLAEIKEIVEAKKYLINKAIKIGDRKLEMENPLTGRPRRYIIAQAIY